MKQYKNTPYFVDTEGNVYRDGKKRKKDKTGDYERVVLFLEGNGKSKKYLVHRLVAETFIPNPQNKPQVNHIDGNKLNNKVDNLEWATAKENTQHSIKKLNNKTHGEYNGNSKLKENDIIWIKNNCIPGDKKLGYRPLSKLFNTTKSNIKFIFNNKTWKHI
jgi:hypothetical protein